MDHLSKNISVNLKKIRLGKKMSLDDVSELTGVSKSMLGQIERGDSNPTISTIGKIVNGLKLNIDDLIYPPANSTYMVNREKLTPAKAMEGQYAVYNYFPFDRSGEFEIYGITIQPDGIYQCSPHREKVTEYIVVTRGTLTLKIGDKFYEIKEGDAFRFEPDSEYSCINNGKELLCFTSCFVYSRKY